MKRRMRWRGAKRFLPAAVAALILVQAGGALALRCGNDLVSVGDKAFLVANRCGEPVSKQLIGYTLNEARKRELVIEEWVYGPWAGSYTVITFVGGVATKIESFKE